ncbi:MAG TPA: hypothetical protein VNX01_09385 [Bacteroidia bacterium]|nr:hypothetical protein [Bacteroidia bacterium]
MEKKAKCISLDGNGQKNTLLNKLLTEHNLSVNTYRFDPYKNFKFRLMFNGTFEKALIENGFELKDCNWD